MNAAASKMPALARDANTVDLLMDGAGRILALALQSAIQTMGQSDLFMRRPDLRLRSRPIYPERAFTSGATTVATRRTASSMLARDVA